MINNISFIVIARNEEFAVDRCLHSLVEMPLEDCEIVCVDSNSTDGTLEVMKRYAAQCMLIQVYQCQGYVNAAIARNVGLKHATKEYVFFVDGDVELNPAFITRALEYMQSNGADIVTGQLSEIYYTPGYKEEIRRVAERFLIKEEKTVYHSGGCFIASASVVQKAGFFDERMDQNEDVDFTLRLSRYGRFIAIPVSMGTHHTHMSRRYLKFLMKGAIRCHGLVLRKNLDRPKVIATLVFQKNRGFLPGYAFYALCITAIVAGFITSWPPMYVAAALLGFVAADLAWGFFHGKEVLKHLVTHYCYPLLVLVGILFGAGPKPAATTVEKVC